MIEVVRSLEPMFIPKGKEIVEEMDDVG